MATVDEVWQRIQRHAGEEFVQKRGQRFTYTFLGGRIELSTTNRTVSRRDFERALDRVPVLGPGEFQDLNAPSYLYAILHDDRISRGGW
jgi:hypothetical protein